MLELQTAHLITPGTPIPPTERTVSWLRPPVSPPGSRFPVYLLLDVSDGRFDPPAPPDSEGHARRLPLFGGRRARVDDIEVFDRTMTFAADIMYEIVVEIYRHLGADLFAPDDVWLGVIPFSDDAPMMRNGLVSLSAFHPSLLPRGGGRRLDRALQRANESIHRELHAPRREQHPGDRHPMIFIFLCGEPTDAHGDPDDTWHFHRDRIVSSRVYGYDEDDAVPVYDMYPFALSPRVSDSTLLDLSTAASYRLDPAAVTPAAHLIGHALTLAKLYGWGADIVFPRRPGPILAPAGTGNADPRVLSRETRV